MTVATELQRLVFPRKNHQGTYDNYLRKTAGFYSEEGQCFRFFKGLEFSTLTFYNAFSVMKWQHSSCVDSVFLRLAGQGEVIVQLILARLDDVRKASTYPLSELGGQETIKTILSEERVRLDAQDHFEMDIAGYGEFSSGILYLNIIPVEDGALSYAGFLTNSKPAQSVKLGLIITHFNREDEVNVAVARIRQDFLSDREFRRNADLIVVDNSRNSGIVEGGGVRVIENDNYGGSGGFSRGLLELVRAGDYTHCVFMDDDASCETESLRRTFKLMMFAKIPRMAIAGTLLYADAPSRIYEKGAVFDGLCHRIHPDLNISSERELVYAEEDRIKPNYGGWWFFGFKLADIQYFPFPFFVRGDDISFSLVNKFSIITMNGIASYGDTFESKSGALTTYLDTRSHLVQQIAILRHSRLKVLEVLCRFFLKSLLSMEYANARAVIVALEDLSKGTNFFQENMDMTARMAALRVLSAGQVERDLDSLGLEVDFLQPRKEFMLRKLARFVTFNGLLLPEALLLKRCVFQSRGFRAKFSQIFRYKCIYYASGDHGKGYVVELDRGEVVSCIWYFLKTLGHVVFHYGDIRSDYLSNTPKIMSRDFWAKQYPDS